MSEEDFFNLTNYKAKSNNIRLFGSPLYLSKDGEYVGGDGSWLSPEGNHFEVHYVARFDGKFAAYTLEEMLDLDNSTSIWDSFTNDSGDSAITAMVGSEGYERCSLGYGGLNPQFIQNFTLGDKWEPSEAHN